MKKFILILSLSLLLCACNSGKRSSGSSSAASLTPFPQVSVPAMITDPAERVEYMVNHYWDSFLALDAKTDSAAVLGVAIEEVQQNMLSYFAMLGSIDVPTAAAATSALFDKIERRQRTDSSSLTYLMLTDMVAECLYNPISELRSEDLYRPFVEKMAASPFTEPSKRAGYRFEAEKCAMNPYGAKAPDFEFRDASGRRHSLYDTDASWTMLFFSNPGCAACREIISEIESAGFPEQMIAMGQLAVINIYIDEDVDKWRESLSDYPSSWLSGYDHTLTLRDGDKYFLRAIPSLYLLDSDKRVVLKDAPTGKALAYLENTLHTY